jgi:hypothetical protein
VAEQEDDKKPERIRRGRKWLLRASVFLAGALVVLVFLWISGIRSAEEKLAAIDAARAIPDQENAAVIYAELAQTTDLASDQPELFRTEGRAGPWLSADHPEAAEWLRARQSAIARLMEACQRQKCHFPLPVGTAFAAWTRHADLLTAFRRWAQLLVSAANNDAAEGRIDAGLEKYLCTIKLARHMQQQPLMIDFLTGIAIDALALEAMKSLIVEGDVTGAHLDLLEQGLPSTANTWDKIWPELLEIEELYQKLQPRSWDFLRWLKYTFSSKRNLSRRVRTFYVRLLAARRSSRILVTVRKYKNENRRWPQSLDDIQDVEAAEILIDPANGGSFVYRLTGDSFTLYSKGQNNIDENGSRTGGADDWPIWPREGDLRQRRR